MRTPPSSVRYLDAMAGGTSPAPAGGPASVAEGPQRPRSGSGTLSCARFWHSSRTPRSSGAPFASIGNLVSPGAVLTGVHLVDLLDLCGPEVEPGVGARLSG